MRKRRTFFAAWRFACFLAREFRSPAVVFAALVLVGGTVFHLTQTSPPLSFSKACYGVFCMIFFEMGVIEFPARWYLEPLMFLIPVLGLGAVADSVVRLGYFIFTAKQKLPEWHRMNASVMKNHIVLCGLGKVGYRILQELLALKEDVVVIERNPDCPFLPEARDTGVTIIIGEARLKKTLDEANVKAARAAILATDDDLANIDAALTAREIRPDIRVVLRLFDDTLATKVATTFNMPAISTSSCSATFFVAAATERSLFHSFQLGGQKLHIADVRLAPRSRLAGKNVGEVQKEFDVNIVMSMSDGKGVVNPAHEVTFAAGDHMVVLAPIEAISKLEEANR